MILLALAFISTYSQLPLPKQLNRISFGSCYGKAGRKNKIFDKIELQNPDIFLWLGDAVYLDKLNQYMQFQASDQQTVMQIFDTYKNDACYKDFREKFPIIGVWDDHDYNLNNGDNSNPTKYWMQELFLDFLDEPKDSVRRTNQGIYTSYQFENLKMILLDARFNKLSNDILGENQWEWLESQLNDSDNSRYTFIASGTQILTTERFICESWDSDSKKRLFKMIKQSKREGVVFLSGDLHLSEFLKTPQPQFDMDYNIYEFTSSGMTHTGKDVFYFLPYVIDLIYPETYKLSNEYPKVHEKNFGIIDVFEDKLIWKIIDFHGDTVQTLQIDYDQISKQNKKPKINIQNEQFLDQYINFESPEYNDILLMRLRNIFEKKSLIFFNIRWLTQYFRNYQNDFQIYFHETNLYSSQNKK